VHCRREHTKGEVMGKEKPITVYSTFRRLWLYNNSLLNDISKELLLGGDVEPGKIKEEFIYNFLRKNEFLLLNNDLNVRSLTKKFVEKDVWGIGIKSIKGFNLFYKIGPLFFSEVGKLDELIENRLLYEAIFNRYKVFTLDSFGVLQVYNSNLSNAALKKFLSVAYGLNTEKLDLHDVQRIYALQNASQCAVIIFNHKRYYANYYECIVITKENVLSFPVSLLPRYRYSFKPANYLRKRENLYRKDRLLTKYIAEKTEDFIDNVNKILRDEINAEEFLMSLHV